MTQHVRTAYRCTLLSAITGRDLRLATILAVSRKYFQKKSQKNPRYFWKKSQKLNFEKISKNRKSQKVSMKNHMNIVIERYELAGTKWEIKYLNIIFIYFFKSLQLFEFLELGALLEN